MKGSLLLVALLYGCSNGGVSKGSVTSSELEQKVTAGAFMDELGVVPLIKPNQEHVITINNTEDNPLAIKKMKLINVVTGIQASSDEITFSKNECTTIQAHNTCGIKVSIRKVGNYMVQAEYSHDKGDVITISQLLRVSAADKLDGSHGVIFDQGLEKTVAKKGNYAVTYPIVFTGSFKNIRGINGLVDCQEAAPGTSCNYRISGGGLKTDTIIELGIEADAVDHISKTVISNPLKLKAATDSKMLRSGALEVHTGIEPNIIMSKGQTITANNLESTTISIYNSGTADAGAFDVVAAEPTKFVIADDCGVSLVQSTACSANVKANFSQHSGSSAINAQYTYGGSLQQTSSIVAYLAPSPEMNVSFSNLTFANTSTGATVSKDLRVTNRGNYPLTSIRYSLTPSTLNTLSASVTGLPAGVTGCTSTLTLESGATCVIRLTYQPGATVAALSHAVVNFAGEYTHENTALHYVTDTYIPYSAVTPSAVNNIATSAENFTLRTQPTQLVAESVTLTNTGSTTVTITGITLDDNVENTLSVSPDGGGCQTLNAGGSCTFSVGFSPTAGTTNGDSNIVVAFSDGPKNIPFKYQTLPNGSVSVTTAVTVATSAVGVDAGETGQSNATAFSFIPLSNNIHTLSYSFTNNSSFAINDFNVATSSLPVGAAVVTGDSTCGIGHEIQQLAANESCVVNVRVPSQEVVDFPALIPAGTFAVQLPFSYTQNDGKVYKNSNQNTIRYFNISDTDWANVSSTPVGPIAIGSTPIDITVTVAGKSSLGATIISGPYVITPKLANGGSAVLLEECTTPALANLSASCAVKVGLGTLPAGSYTLMLEITSTNGLVQTEPVILNKS